MDREKVIEIFNQLLCGERNSISYSRGYKEFEEQYELNKEYLEREEINQMVILKRNYESRLDQIKKVCIDENKILNR